MFYGLISSVPLCHLRFAAARCSSKKHEGLHVIAGRLTQRPARVCVLGQGKVWHIYFDVHVKNSVFFGFFSAGEIANVNSQSTFTGSQRVSHAELTRLEPQLRRTLTQMRYDMLSK